MSQRSAAEIRREIEDHWREYDLALYHIAIERIDPHTGRLRVSPRREAVGKLYRELAEAERREAERGTTQNP